MIAAAPSLTGPTDQWFDPFGISNLQRPPCSGSSTGVIYFYAAPTYASTNIDFAESRQKLLARSLSHKQWVSWCNMLDRMDERRHARGAELCRLPDSKALAPKPRSPSVGRVCSGSSRYRVLRPCS
jgi:hypothetical protein